MVEKQMKTRRTARAQPGPGESPARPLVALRRLDDREKRDAVMAAISAFPLGQDPQWQKLAKRLQPTSIDEIDAVPEGIFASGSETDKTFAAAATVYVRWDDEIDGRHTSSVEGLPAEVKGHFTDARDGAPVAVVDAMSVDAASVLE